MNIYVINLDRSPERLRHMETTLGEHGLGFTRVVGVDGAELDAETYEAISHFGTRRLSRGEIGCFLSHRACWSRIADGAAAHGVVFEDDVVLGRDAGLVLGGDGWVPDSAEIIKLETYLRPAFVGKRPIARIGGRSVARLQSAHLGTGGYLLSRKAAQRLVELSERIPAQVDDFIFNPDFLPFREFEIHQMTPALCAQGLILQKRGRGMAPEGHAVLASELYSERLGVLPRIGTGRKVVRELKASAVKAAQGISGFVSTLFGSRRWGRVPFE